MQFRRVQANLAHKSATLPHVDLEHLRALVAREYEVFTATLARWTGLTDAWYQKTRSDLVQRWEEASFRSETRALLAELRLQHRRLKHLDAQLA
jgi:stearoyl-CoA desaturase (delta-9 desaturase)